MSTFTAQEDYALDSQVLSHVWYGHYYDDPNTNGQEGLLLEFNSGARFFYRGTKDTYRNMLASSSPGRFYNTELKGEGSVLFTGVLAFDNPDLGGKEFAVELKPVAVFNKDVRVRASNILEAVEMAEEQNPGFAVIAVREF